MKANYSRAIMLTIFTFIVSLGTINAKVLTVTGTLTDENGNGISISRVSVDEVPNSSVLPDADGKYKIQVEKGNTLVFSALGYQHQEVKVSKKVYNVVLQRKLFPSQEEISAPDPEVLEIMNAVQEQKKKKTVFGPTTNLTMADIRAAQAATEISNRLAENAAGVMSGEIPAPDPEVIAIIESIQQQKQTIKETTLVDARLLHAETYKIEELSSPEKLLPTVPSDYLFGRVDKNFLELSVANELVDLGTQPVITGYLRAYQNHYPVTISPDIAWLLICQGFSRHVNNNSEALRHRFVDFEGQETLIVERNMSGTEGLAVFPWETVFPEFVQQIAGFTGKELIENLSADFTTTTPASLIAGQITIMESMKEFFKYKVVMIGCGIPEVTIEGTVEDWEKIFNRLDYLSQYELDWWTSELKPVIQKIIDTKKGTFDRDFWMNMIKYHETGFYGSYDGVDGWFLKFYPYKRDGKRSDFKEIKGIGVLPSELANVPFVFEVQDETRNVVVTYNMEFWAGFMGVTQDRNTFSIKPEIGWAVNIPSNGSIKKHQ